MSNVVSLAPKRRLSKAEKDFFKKQTDSSRIKANIVCEYVPKYCHIIKKAQPKVFRYIDLFSGPGCYDDGQESTPLLLARRVANDEFLRENVRMIFNDDVHCSALQENFTRTFPQGTFKLEPQFRNYDVFANDKVREFLGRSVDPVRGNDYPTVLFFDPFGYQGVDTRLLATFLSHFGNEIFLFLNVSRILGAIENPKMVEHAHTLFPLTLDMLRGQCASTRNVSQKVSYIVQALATEFKAIVGDGLYHCAFKFMDEDSIATSHLIVHLTKNHRGYSLVKQVYHDYDNIGATLDTHDGTYTFDAKKMYAKGVLNLDGNENAGRLAVQLFERFRGQTITGEALFEQDQVSTQYAATHYREALRLLEAQGKLHATFTDEINHRKRVLLTPTCILQFS